MKLSQAELKEFLEEKYDKYNRPEFIESDPIFVPHQFSKKEDIEIAGFFSASFAWGQRPTIIRNGLRLMKLMDDQPYEFVMHHSENDLKIFRGFAHRTFNATDVAYFVKAMQHVYLHCGGLEKSFVPLSHSSRPITSQSPFRGLGQRKAGTQKTDMYNGFIQFRKLFLGKHPPGRTAKHIADVSKNASAKRLNMYLRWMVRNDKRGVDFGLWKSISPALLYCPLDVHSGRIARKLGLLKRRQDDWKAVDELTKALRKFDPKDPIKYDFALYGLGVFEKF